MANENVKEYFKLDSLEPMAGYEGESRLDAVVLAPGNYAKGQVLGQVAGTGTAVDQAYTFAATSPTAGTWRIVYSGVTDEITASLAYNANAAAVQAALEALPSIGTGNVTVTGGPLGSTLTVTFGADLAGKPIVLTAISSVTNVTPTLLVITVTETGAGKPAGGYWAKYDDSAIGVAKGLLKYPCYVNALGKISVGPSEAGYTKFAVPAYFTGVFQTKNMTGIDANAVADLGKLLSGTTGTLTANNTILRIGV